jgi:hypothetical protein
MKPRSYIGVSAALDSGSELRLEPRKPFHLLRTAEDRFIILGRFVELVDPVHKARLVKQIGTREEGVLVGRPYQPPIVA